jgi:CubicO group peptidase (beta-lactamase class C family)
MSGVIEYRIVKHPEKMKSGGEMSKRTILTFGLCLAAFILLGNANFFFKKSNQNDPDDPFAEARSVILKTLKKQKVPSVSVALAKDGEILWEESFGWANLEKKIEATPHTMYSLASISKPITATGLMVLVERGLVDLDRPANAYLGEAKIKAFEGEASHATVRRLLHHTAGLGMQWNFFYENKPYRRPSMDESIRRYGVCVYPPGKTYNYANFGYGIIDYIIERVSQKTYPEFMKTEVFEPLGLHHTEILIAPAAEDRVAARYKTIKNALAFYDFDHRGASAVYSSAHDLVRFGMFHLKNHLSDQKPILKDKTIVFMQEAVDPGLPKSGYKLGWSVYDLFGFKTVSHSGGMPGVTTNLRILPEANVALVVLCNRSGINLRGVIHSVLSSILPEYKKAWEEAKEEESKRKTPKFTPPPELVGVWTGEIKTYQETLPVQMQIEKKGKIWFKVIGEKYRYETGLSTVNPPQFTDDHLIATFNIQILKELTQRSAPFLMLNMTPHNDTTELRGYAAAQAYDGEYCLPSYIHLKKKTSE